MIAAGSLTADYIGTSAITADKIAAGAITTIKLDAGAVTAAKIAAGTITATELAANSVTASKIDVTSLSAISADLGTITAGTISGTTFYAGGTNVVLNSSGLTLTSGGATTNQLKWSSGSFIKDVSGALSLNASAIELAVTSHAVAFDSSNAALFPSSGTVTLGVTGARWSDLWLTAAGSVAGKLADFEARISALENP